MSEFIPNYDLPDVNRQIILAHRPNGIPVSTDFTQSSTNIPTPKSGEFLVRNLYLSADPVQRGWAANEAVTPLGNVMHSLAVGVVTQSNEANIGVGDVVFGYFGWQDYAIATMNDVLSHTAKPRVPISLYAGVLGMPGVTAYLALELLAPVKAGQTVLVSTAAGSVGSVVGQLAKRAGANVVGLTGSAEKIERCLGRYGFDAAFNYKEIDLATALTEAAPQGYDTYFDNTGGDILDHAIRSMARYGRIIQCGTAATAKWVPGPQGLRNEREMLYRVLTWSGFYIFDHVARFNETIETLTDIMLDGRLEYDEDIETGIEAAPHSLEALFSGANQGKKLIDISKIGQ